MATEKEPDFDELRTASLKRFEMSWEHIYEKYGREFPDSDEVDLCTGEIVVDNGELLNIKKIGFGDLYQRNAGTIDHLPLSPILSNNDTDEVDIDDSYDSDDDEDYEDDDNNYENDEDDVENNNIDEDNKDDVNHSNIDEDDEYMSDSFLDVGIHEEVVSVISVMTLSKTVNCANCTKQRKCKSCFDRSHHLKKSKLLVSHFLLINLKFNRSKRIQTGKKRAEVRIPRKDQLQM